MRLHTLLCRCKHGSMEDLYNYTDQDEIHYLGATGNYRRRSGEHKNNGYRGTMLYTETEDMKRDENTLLKVCKSSNNKKKSSGMPREKPGYVYVIKDDSESDDEREGWKEEPGYDGRKEELDYKFEPAYCSYDEREVSKEEPGYDGRRVSTKEPGYYEREVWKEEPGYDGRKVSTKEPGYYEREVWKEEPGYDGRKGLTDYEYEPGYKGWKVEAGIESKAGREVWKKELHYECETRYEPGGTGYGHRKELGYGRMVWEEKFHYECETRYESGEPRYYGGRPIRPRY